MNAIDISAVNHDEIERGVKAIAAKHPNVVKKTRVKRTEAQMLQSVAGDVLSEASYLKNRLQKLEEKMGQLMLDASAEARKLVTESRGGEHLTRYLP